MATVKRIFVRLKTGDRPGAGSDGEVFLGLGGREFNLNSPAQDREQNSEDEYKLGDGADILNKEKNDPRTGCPLEQGQLFFFPVYIRFQGQNLEDNWNLESVGVEVTSSDPHDPAGAQLNFSRLVGPDFHLWLGDRSGNYCYLNPTGPFPAG